MQILELEGLLKILIDRKNVKKRELESLVGKLIFFSKAVRGSRAFNRRFYDAMILVAIPHYKVRVSSAVREDMHMWLQFLDKFNGITYFPQQEWVHSTFPTVVYRQCRDNRSWMWLFFFSGKLDLL